MRTNHSLVFTKMQGVGNDFVVVDGRELSGLDWSGLAIELCDRRFGVGSDGLLVIERSAVADFTMRMYNPDGTADVCGNGLRCVARFVAERIRKTGEAETAMTLYTLAGGRTAVVHAQEPGKPRLVTVDMGTPRFDPRDIPMDVDVDRVIDYPLQAGGDALHVTSLSTGTTHTVLFVEELPGDDIFLQLSPRIEHHRLFPERTTVMWTHVKSRHDLEVRIWERGAGETWGCGTGACAAAVAALEHGYTEGPVTVHSKGGDLRVEWTEGQPIRMTGPAAFVFEGSYPLDPDGLAR